MGRWVLRANTKQKPWSACRGKVQTIKGQAEAVTGAAQRIDATPEDIDLKARVGVDLDRKAEGADK